MHDRGRAAPLRLRCHELLHRHDLPTAAEAHRRRHQQEPWLRREGRRRGHPSLQADRHPLLPRRPCARLLQAARQRQESERTRRARLPQRARRRGPRPQHHPAQRPPAAQARRRPRLLQQRQQVRGRQLHPLAQRPLLHATDQPGRLRAHLRGRAQRRAHRRRRARPPRPPRPRRRLPRPHHARPPTSACSARPRRRHHPRAVQHPRLRSAPSAAEGAPRVQGLPALRPPARLPPRAGCRRTRPRTSSCTCPWPRGPAYAGGVLWPPGLLRLLRLAASLLAARLHGHGELRRRLHPGEVGLLHPRQDPRRDRVRPGGVRQAARGPSQVRQGHELAD